MKKAIGIVIVIAILLALSGCSRDREEDPVQATEAENAENKVADFTVFDENGEMTSLYNKLLEKPVIVNFWATWCPPCKSEMPAFEALYGEYGDDIEFMMVNLTDGQRDTEDKVIEFISDNEYNFPVYYDKKMNAAHVYNVQSIPTTIFINADGSLFDIHTGALSEGALRDTIEKLLSE